MKKLLTSLGLLASTALLAAGFVHAKDEAKTSAPSNKGAAAAPSSGTSSAGGMQAGDDKAKNGAQIDINSATEKELSSLPKIGDVKARAIVKGRPYRSKDQLVDKKILSQDAYDSIKDQIIAKQGTAMKGAAADAKNGAAKDSKK